MSGRPQKFCVFLSSAYERKKWNGNNNNAHLYNHQYCQVLKGRWGHGGWQTKCTFYAILIGNFLRLCNSTRRLSSSSLQLFYKSNHCCVTHARNFQGIDGIMTFSCWHFCLIAPAFLRLQDYFGIVVFVNVKRHQSLTRLWFCCRATYVKN